VLLNAGTTFAADSPADTTPSDYRVLKATCSSIAVSGRAQCAKDVKGKGNATVISAKMKEALWRCEDLMSREERQCIVRELEVEHPDTSRPSQAPIAPAPPPR
jgi:hypothetical protein